MKQRTTLLPDALLILTTFIWGSGFAITNLAVLSGMPLSMLLTLRFLIPGVIMMVLFRKELPSASSEDLRFGAVAGVILFVAFVAQTYGIKYTTPANNAFLTTTNVIMVPLISWGVFRQRPQLRLGLLTMLCFVGMSVLSWSPGLGVAFNLGDWLSILCAMGFACHISYLGLSSAMACSAAVLSLVQIMVAGS
ncbi:MAG: DMT family transporter, partial [Oscillospiraceae bacterium]